ncbi:hypothetical protein Pint_31264 [Pistacia integerrima]|uniref:Uncharacterized protein n=1 Tax=Pistacia integerrima TaxID=434235 RepID=A0ACC0XNZ1_9ROSI|nr:hypothetical protein Pint_31264 [Pistacia integerrima]
MKTFFIAQELWELVENGFVETTTDVRELRKKDAKALRSGGHTGATAYEVDTCIGIYPAGRMLGTSSDHEVKEASKKELIEIFKVLEGELGDKPYYGGDTFGFVDVALIPYYSFFHTFETLGNFNFEAECPKLVSWAKRCMQKTSVSKSLCDQHKVYEVVLELKKKLGVE